VETGLFQLLGQRKLQVKGYNHPLIRKRVIELKNFTLLFFAGALLAVSAAEAKDAPAVRTLMTPEDYSESGLDKLSEAERAHLSEWVERYREGAVIGPEVHKRPSQMTPDERVVHKKEVAEARATQIVAKVVPAFKGWNGKTMFRLDNGQQWQQRTTGRLRYSGADSTVTISQNAMGKYVMKHQGTGRAVGVVRVD
jgi:hypothetical protein